MLANFGTSTRSRFRNIASTTRRPLFFSGAKGGSAVAFDNPGNNTLAWGGGADAFAFAQHLLNCNAVVAGADPYHFANDGWSDGPLAAPTRGSSSTRVRYRLPELLINLFRIGHILPGRESSGLYAAPMPEVALNGGLILLRSAAAVLPYAVHVPGNPPERRYGCLRNRTRLCRGDPSASTPSSSRGRPAHHVAIAISGLQQQFQYPVRQIKIRQLFSSSFAEFIARQQHGRIGDGIGSFSVLRQTVRNRKNEVPDP